MYRVRRIYEWLNKKLFFNLFLRTIMEGYLNFCITSFISMNKLSYSNTGDILDSLFAIILLTIVGVFPIFTVAFLYFHKKKLRNENFKVRFDSLYDNVVVEKDNALLFSTFFITRRLFYAVTISFIGNYVYL